MVRKQRRVAVRRCRVCGGVGHNRQTCPNRKAETGCSCPRCGTMVGERTAHVNELMVVVWTTTPENPAEGFATFTSHNGIRVYEQSTPDPRSMLGRDALPPLFEGLGDAVDWMLEQPAKSWCRLRFDAALTTFGPQQWAFYLPEGLNAPTITCRTKYSVG